MTRLDLYCADGFEIGLIGSVYYVSVTIGTVLVLYWADFIGRLKVYTVSHTATVVLMFGCLFAPSYHFLLFALSLMGLF